MSATSRKTDKPWPTLESDEAAERFVAEADLSEYDWSAMKPARFEFQEKDARVTMRMPQRQLDAIKAEASRRGVKYQRLIRELLEQGLETLR